MKTSHALNLSNRRGGGRDANGDSYPWIVKTAEVVNHFYVYAVDAEFGPFFLKFCSYFPFKTSDLTVWRFDRCRRCRSALLRRRVTSSGRLC